MPGLLTWANDKIQQTYNSAQTTYNLYVKDKLEKTYNGAAIAYNAATNVVSGTITFLSPYNFKTGIVHALTGATKIFDPYNYIFLFDAPRARHILGQSFLNDASYLAMHALYAGPIKSTLRSMPGLNNYFVEATADKVASAAIYSLWMYFNSRYTENPPESKKAQLLDALLSITHHRLTAEMFLSNTINSLTLATVAEQENERLLELPQNQKRKVIYNASCADPYKPCDCLFCTKWKGKAYVLLETAAEIIATSYVIPKLVPYIGEELGELLSWISLGKLLMRYKLLEMCLRHQHEILDQNTMFAFGFGGSFRNLTKYLTSYITSHAGMKDHEFFVWYAVNAFLGQLFAMAAILQGRRYPGNGTPHDIFWLPHQIMYLVLDIGIFVSTPIINLVNRLVNFVSTPNSQTDWQQQVKDIVESKYFKEAVKVLPRDMQTLEAFLRTQPVKDWFDEHTQGIRNKTDYVNKTRTVPLANKIPTLTEMTPELILENKLIRNFLVIFFGEAGKKTIAEFISRLNDVRNKQLKTFAGKDIPAPPSEKKELEVTSPKVVNEVQQQTELMQSKTTVETTANLPKDEMPKTPVVVHRIAFMDKYDPSARREQAFFQPKPKKAAVALPAIYAPRAGINAEG